MPESVRPAATVAVMTVAAISALYFTTMQVRAMDEIDETYAMPDDEYAVFRWIEDNLSQSDTVVTSSWITNQQLAALTPASTYLADGFITRVSTEELADRYLRVSATYGIDEEVAFYRIDPERDVPTSNKDVPDPALERYYDEAMVYYLFNEGIRQPSQLVDRFPDWRRKYADLTAGSGVLRAYEADYLYCGHRESFWEPSSVAPGTWVQEAYRSGDAVLYRLAPDASDGAVEFEGCARP
jgi:hypothetical protein